MRSAMALLRLGATRLIDNARADDTVARIGRDEFTVLMRLSEDGPAPAALAERLVAELSRPYEIDGALIEIGVSIGLACCPDDAAAAERLVQCADAALYRAKNAGRSTFRNYAMLRDAA